MVRTKNYQVCIYLFLLTIFGPISPVVVRSNERRFYIICTAARPAKYCSYARGRWFCGALSIIVMDRIAEEVGNVNEKATIYKWRTMIDGTTNR